MINCYAYTMLHMTISSYIHVRIYPLKYILISRRLKVPGTVMVTCIECFEPFFLLVGP